MAHVRPVLAVLVAGVVYAGCGGGTTPSSPSPQPSPTPAPSPTPLPTPAPASDLCEARTGPESTPFVVYADAGDSRNHFIPSGFFGDTTDLMVTQTDNDNPRSGSSSIRIDYTPRGPEKFAGVFWQCPADNWGTVPNAGFNLSRATRVRFFARGSRAGVRVEFKVGGIGHPPQTQPYPDSLPATPSGQVSTELSTSWAEFMINVSGQNLSRVIGGFIVWE